MQIYQQENDMANYNDNIRNNSFFRKMIGCLKNIQEAFKKKQKNEDIHIGSKFLTKRLV